MDPRSFRRTAAAVVALAAVALAAAQPSLPPPPGRLVDVGGRSLHVYCVGEGSPTVVLEAGLGDGSIGFRSLQSRVAGFISTAVILLTNGRSASASEPPINPKPTLAR